MAAAAQPPPRPEPASTVRHKNLPPWILGCLIPSFLALLALSIGVILSLVWITARHLFGSSGPLFWIAASAPPSFIGYKVYKFVARIVQVGRSLETGEKSVTEWDGYRDERLMSEVWAGSPYNRHRNDGLKSSTIRSEIEDEAISFQPKEGYCGPASVNTVLQSLNPPMAIPFSRLPQQYSMVGLSKYLEEANLAMGGETLFERVDLVQMTDEMSLEEFRRHVLDANSPDCRVLVNYHRKPLFAPECGGWRQALNKVMGAHWSPIGGVLPGERPDSDAALVLDVNKSYGPCLIPMRRLFGAVKTKNVHGAFRGLIKLYLKSDSNSPVDKKDD